MHVYTTLWGKVGSLLYTIFLSFTPLNHEKKSRRQQALEMRTRGQERRSRKLSKILDMCVHTYTKYQDSYFRHHVL